MTRRWLPFCLLIVAGLVVRADDPKPGADDPPVRLKKKNKAPAAVELPKDEKKDDEKKDEKKDDEKIKDDMPKPEPGPGAREDEKEVLERIARNMKSVEERIVNKELNEGTKQLQDDILKDLDALIQMAENPPPSSSPQGGAGMPPPDGGEEKGTTSRQQPNPMTGGMNPMADMNPMTGRNPMTGTKPMPGGTNPGTNPDGSARSGNSSEPPMPPNDDKSSGRIALRETKRTEAKTEGSNGESVPKYQELIQAYRKNLARPKDSR